nr:uncharacterized protein LOC118681753 [Bactrocera oleae]
MAAVLTILTTSLHQIHATKMHKRLHRCCFNSSGNISGKAVSKALQQSSTALMCADVHTMPAEARRETSIGREFFCKQQNQTEYYISEIESVAVNSINALEHPETEAHPIK